MKKFVSTFLFISSVIGTTSQAQAAFLPGAGPTPIYACQGESLAARIYRQDNGGALVVISHSIQSKDIIRQEQVTELSSKQQTLFSSDDLVLKVSQNPTGYLPGTMFLDLEGEVSKVKMNCQVVYHIMSKSTVLNQ